MDVSISSLSATEPSVSFSIIIVCRFFLEIRERNAKLTVGIRDSMPMTSFVAATRYTRDIVEELGDASPTSTHEESED